MDKYEYNVKSDQIKKLAARKDFKIAAEIADTIDWNRVKNTTMISLVADIYENNKEYSKAKEALLIAYERSPLGRQLAYKLTLLSLKTKEYIEAEEFYHDFKEMAPNDISQYILKYEIAKAGKQPIGILIGLLEVYLEEDMDERWAYELASLYDEAGETEKCVSQCDMIILWFNEGKYVERALKLKMKHAPLTNTQQLKYEELVELSRVKEEEDRKEAEKKALETEERVARKQAGDEGFLDDNSSAYEDSQDIDSQVRSNMEAAYSDSDDDEYDMSDSDEDYAGSGVSGDTLQLEETKDGEVLSNVKEMVDASQIKVKEVNFDKYNTTNIQEALAKSMSLLLNEDDIPEIIKPADDYNTNTSDEIQDVNIISKENDVSREAKDEFNEEKVDITGRTTKIFVPISELNKEEEEEAIEETEEEVEPEDRIIPGLEIEDDGQISLNLEDDQIEGQLTLAEVLTMYQNGEFDEGRHPSEELLENRMEMIEEGVLDRFIADSSANIVSEMNEEDVNTDTDGDMEFNNDSDSDDIKELSDIVDSIESEDAAYAEANNEDLDKEEQDILDEETESGEDVSDISEMNIPVKENGEIDDMALKILAKAMEGAKLSLLNPSLEANLGLGDLEDEEDEDSKRFKFNPDFGDDSEEEAAFTDEEDVDSADEYDENQEENEEEFDDEPEEDLDDDEVQEYEEESNSDADDSVSDMDNEDLSDNEDSSDNKEVSNSAEPDKKPAIKIKAEVKDYFASFVVVDELTKQVKEAIINAAESLVESEGKSVANNVVVMGDTKTGKTTLAIEVIKAINRQIDRKGRKVAKINATVLNSRGLIDSMGKLKGADLIIERAANLNPLLCKELSTILSEDTDGTIVVLEDDKSAMERMLKANPQLEESFSNHIYIKEYDIKEWAKIAKQYAKDRGYTVDAMGELALHAKIDEMYGQDEQFGREEIEAMMEKAIKRHSRKSIGKLFARNKKAIDELESLVESDFN